MEKSKTPYERLVSLYLIPPPVPVDTRIFIALIEAVLPHWSSAKRAREGLEKANETLSGTGPES